MILVPESLELCKHLYLWRRKVHTGRGNEQRENGNGRGLVDVDSHLESDGISRVLWKLTLNSGHL